MNILRLVYEWPPPWDGLTPGPYELTQAQLKLGHRVVVFCGGKSVWQLGSLAARQSEGGQLVVRRFSRVVKRFSIFLTTAPAVWLGYLWLRLTGRGPGLVHGHGHITLWFNLYKLLFGWLDKTPYVLHLHITAAGRAASSTFEVGSAETSKVFPAAGGAKLDFWTKYFEWPLHKLSDWLGVRVADRVICVSSRVMDEAIEFYGADFEELVVVENGVNTDLFFSSPHTAYRITHNVLYVGALTPRKGAHLLIKGFKFLPDDYHLTIVGRGSKEYENQLHRLAQELKIENRVEFKGYIEYHRLPEVYQQAGLFILPSKYEGLPKVVLEALARGVPVLASGFDTQNPIGGLEFVENLDPESLAERIQQMLNSDIKVDVSKVAEVYSWDRKAQEIEDMYQSL